MGDKGTMVKYGQVIQYFEGSIPTLQKDIHYLRYAKVKLMDIARRYKKLPQHWYNFRTNHILRVLDEEISRCNVWIEKRKKAIKIHTGIIKDLKRGSVTSAILRLNQIVKSCAPTKVPKIRRLMDTLV